MRFAVLVMLACLATSVQPSYAQSGDVSPRLLIGKWSASATMPNGAVMATDLALTQDMKFNGSATVQGKEFWTYSGTWEVKGSQLIWHYENSSQPLPESAKTDIDDIVAVDAEKLVLASKLTGKQSVYLRAR
jgi:hypothetical protein